MRNELYASRSLVPFDTPVSETVVCCTFPPSLMKEHSISVCGVHFERGLRRSPASRRRVKQVLAGNDEHVAIPPAA